MRCLLLLLSSGSPLIWEMLSLTAVTISAVRILWRAIANFRPFSKPLCSSMDNSSEGRFITHLSFRDEPEFTGDLLLSKWQNFLLCFSLCLVNVCCSFEWQNSLTQEVLELLIKAERSLNEQENNACKHSMELWHSSICNFRKPMSLYPLAFYKDGWNLKLDGST